MATLINIIIIFMWIPCIFIVHCLLFVPTNAHVYIKILNYITSASLYFRRCIFFLVKSPIIFMWIPCIFIVYYLLFVPTNAHIYIYIYIKILNYIISACNII